MGKITIGFKLAEKLIFLDTDHTSRAAQLEDAARGIRLRLEVTLTRDLRHEHAHRLQQLLERRGDYLCAEAVFLLAAAAVDEADGLAGSTRSLMSYLADPTRFSQPWVDAMHDTLSALRHSLGIK